MMIEQAEKVAPTQVGAYLDAVAEMPGALVDLLGAKSFGGAVDLSAQQQCARLCTEHVTGLNQRAIESVRSMYQHLERLAAQAEAQATREAKAAQKEQAAKLSTRRRVTFWILFPVWLFLVGLIAFNGEPTPERVIGAMIAFGILLAIMSSSVMGLLQSLGL